MRRHISFVFMTGESADVELKADTSFQLESRSSINSSSSTSESWFST